MFSTLFYLESKECFYLLDNDCFKEHSEKHSYDNKTGIEDLFVAVGGRNDSMLRHPGELGTPEICVITACRNLR